MRRYARYQTVFLKLEEIISKIETYLFGAFLFLYIKYRELEFCRKSPDIRVKDFLLNFSKNNVPDKMCCSKNPFLLI